MPYEDIQVESYKFTNFEQSENRVSFRVATIEGRDLTTDDRDMLEAFLDDIGKWESLVKAGLNLLFELSIVQVDETTLQKYQKEFGSEKYTRNIGRDSLGRYLYVHVRLSRDERHRREGTGLDSTLQVQEIYDQLNNVPKWRAFKKAVELIGRNVP